MRKIISTIIFLLSTLLILTACGTEKVKDDPEISIKFKVSNLTDEEFQFVGTKELETALKDDFKNIEFSLDVKNSNNISNRKIVIPDFKNVVKSYDKKRYWFGEASRQDNSSENFAQYGNKIVFYSKGLDEQAIKNIFGESEVRVSWTTNSGKDEEKVFKLGEIVQFQ